VFDEANIPDDRPDRADSPSAGTPPLPPVFTDTTEAAQYYIDRDFAVVPIPPGCKAPVVYGWQSRKFCARDFSPASNIGIVLGEPSGWLIDIDLDAADARELADELLPPTDAVSGRPSSPRSHRWYIARGATTKKFADPTTRKMIVELRSTGCQTVVGPSIHPSGERYEPLTEIPCEVDADYLLECVETLWRAVLARRGIDPPKPQGVAQITHSLPAPVATSGAATPGATAPEHSNPPSGDTRTAPLDAETRAVAYLNAMPAAISGSGGHAATFSAAVAVVHGFGLSQDVALSTLLTHYNPRCNSPWSLAELTHKVKSATSVQHSRPFGWLRDAPGNGAFSAAEAYPDVDISGILPAKRPPLATPSGTDPGVIPVELLRVPGFISDVMDHCLATAPYPNQALAFAGAVSLQAFLAGRKVRDESDLRTNFYLLALAHSGSGKDWPRRVNSAIIEQVGLMKQLGNDFASSEGLQDALTQRPNMLFQTDEIDALIQAIAKGREPRYEAIMKVLLTLFTSAGISIPGRVKAGSVDPDAIRQPCLNIFGTAIPTHYYAALRGAMLSNGFLARTLTIETGGRGKRQRARSTKPPPHVIEIARHWAEFKPGGGNLYDENPDPLEVLASDEVHALLAAAAHRADKEYARCEEIGDDIGASVWARVVEHAQKLALVYAVSESHLSPLIEKPAAEWASRLSEHQARRLLWSIDNSTADDACGDILRRIRSAGGEVAHGVLLKQSKIRSKEFEPLIQTLIERGEIAATIGAQTGGRPSRLYSLAV
jgi:hypothetical protein